MPNFEDFLELTRARRSIRRFKPDPVPDEHILKIIEAARWAMSGANGQPWEFVIVKDPETRGKILETYLEDGKEQDAVEMTRMPEIRQPMIGMRNRVNFKDAPVIIVVCGDPRTFQATFLRGRFLMERWTFIQNIGNATMMIHLAAAALGLGSEWVSTTPVFEAQLRTILGVPLIFSIPQIVPIGYPAYKPAPSYRRGADEIMHFDRYDMSKYRTEEDIIQYIIQLRKRTSATYRL